MSDNPVGAHTERTTKNVKHGFIIFEGVQSLESCEPSEDEQHQIVITEGDCSGWFCFMVIKNESEPVKEDDIDGKKGKAGGASGKFDNPIEVLKIRLKNIVNKNREKSRLLA